MMGESSENSVREAHAEEIPARMDGQADIATTESPESLGRRLREARERLNLSVADVAGQIKFAPRQIEALEADDLKHLQGAAFLRGFVRSYAKILSVDMQSLRKLLPETRVDPVRLVPPSVEEPFPTFWSARRRQLSWMGGALLLALILLGFAAKFFAAPPEGMIEAQIKTPVVLPEKVPAQIESIPHSAVQDTSVIGPEVEPAAPIAINISPPDAPVAKPSAQLPKSMVEPGLISPGTKLRMMFDEESWVEIQDKDERRLTSQINPPGSRLDFEGKLPLSLVIGHAESVRLYRDGDKIDLKPYINKFSEVARLTLE